MKSQRTFKLFLLAGILVLLFATACNSLPAELQNAETGGNTTLTSQENTALPAELGSSAATPETSEITPSPDMNVSSTDEDVELVAPVEAIGDGTIVVAGQTLQITDQTEIKGELETGAPVKVRVTITADGVAVAREIELAEAEDLANANQNDNENNANDDDDANQNMDDQDMDDDDDRDDANQNMGDQDMDDDRDANQNGNMDDDDDTNVAEGEEGEITAPVEAINDGAIVVAGQTLLITDQTEIKGEIQVGTLVKVHFLVTADGTLVVREIEAVDENDVDDDDRDDANQNMGDQNMNDDDHDANQNAGDDDRDANQNMGDQNADDDRDANQNVNESVDDDRGDTGDNKSKDQEDNKSDDDNDDRSGSNSGDHEDDDRGGDHKKGDD